MARMRTTVWITLWLATACTPTVPHALLRDANVDAPGDPIDPNFVGGVHLGGGADAGHDAGRSGTCAARILVIFDRSGSMATEWSGGGMAGPRWQIAETAVTTAVQAHESQLTVGAILFPSAESSSLGETCALVDPIARQIPFASGASFLSTWSATWSSAMLFGSTPIDAAFDAADAALAGAGAETAVVLLTDGEPTCTGSISASARAASWHARGISTWVVGLPGSEAGVTYLSGIASAGGTTPLSVDDPSALSTALAGIAGTQVESQCTH